MSYWILKRYWDVYLQARLYARWKLPFFQLAKEKQREMKNEKSKTNGNFSHFLSSFFYEQRLIKLCEYWLFDIILLDFFAQKHLTFSAVNKILNLKLRTIHLHIRCQRNKLEFIIFWIHSTFSHPIRFHDNQFSHLNILLCGSFKFKQNSVKTFVSRAPIIHFT